ncbi:MAG TPA: M56 family metallopeptidase, partial [Pirellulales bacterium]|nr:M56 family metallopeptidase [Pirellulales bacterium]
MRALTAWLSSALSSSWAQLAVDVTVKATVLLLLAMLAAAMLRRSSAAVRHRVWCLTFVGLLLLPALSAGLPEWRLAVLPKVVGTLRVPQLPTLESAPAESGALAAPRRDSAQMDSTQRERLFAGPPSFAAPGSPLAEREDYGTRAQRLQPQLPPVASDQANEPAVAHWTIYYLVALWLLGALVAAAPLIIGLLRNYLLRRHARPVAEAAWTGLLDELRARLGLRRQVALYETQTALMPMTWGLLSPVVLLPHRARTWTDRLRRFVLLHELAHVKRCDVGFQMLARLACALYWFHPLAWYALRRLRIERELACDDCVVQAGERPSDYAAELLQIARSFQPLRLTAAVPMAQTSNLEHRIRALFDRARSHLPISSRAARLLLLAATVTVTSIAVIRLAPRPTAEADEPKAAASDSQPDVAQPSSAGAETPTRYFRGAKGDNAQPPSAGAEASSDNAVAIRGRVLDVKGKPIPGARVRVMRIDTESTSWAEVQAPVLADVRTDAEGVFSARYAAESPVATREQFILSTTVVLADADGYAFDWREVKPGEDQFSLQLSPDDAPILGRVLDLEGRPVEGVHVGIHAVQGGGENLDAWIEQAKQNPPSVDEESIGRPIGKRGGGPKIARFPGGKSLETGRPELLPQAVTDQRGRFQLAGLGRDRLVTLELAGGGIAKTWLHVATRDMPAVPYPEYDPRFRVQTCFGRRFELTAEPEQPIAGVIRDADTGEPLPGVEVRLYQYAESLLMVEGFISAVTDKQGRYTLRGTAKPSHPERSTRLRVVPAAGQPYFRTELHVGKQEGLGSATCNVELKRATLIRGQVTDAITGRPIVGLVSYFPFLSNKAAEDYANFVAGMTTMGMFESDATSDDGTFVVPGLPGRGVLAFEAKNDGRYPQSDGAAAIADLTQTTGRGLNLYHLPTTELATALREVDPPTGAAEITCDIKIKPVATVPIRLIDEAGQPLTGVVTRGLRPPRSLGLVFDKEWSPDPLPTDTADLAPGEPPLRRAVLFLHRGRRLATTLWLTEESPPDSLVLRPCGTITGRLVDGSGRPVSGRWVYSRLAQHLDGEAAGRPRDRVEMQHRFASARTDRDGKFQIELLPAGAAYLVSASDGNRQQKAELTTPTLKPGQTFDTGELKLEPSESGGADQPAGAASAAESASAPSATAEDTSHVTLRGLVLDPTGKPFGGAKLFLSYPIVNDLKEQLLGESGKDGRFEFPIDRNSFDVSRVADPWALAKLTAVAEGYGFDWIEAPKAESDCTLRLVDDVPIRGRILTLEGQPVAGAEIKLRQVQVPAQDGIDEFLKMFRAGEVYQFQRKVSQRVPGLRAAATTDAEGRFTLRGLGAERVVELMVAGPGIESWFITAITRDTQPIQRPARWNNSHVYGATFDHLSMPSQKIAGIVRDRKTKKPIADAEVRGSRTVHSARTDAEGRFELLGERKEKEHRLSVLPPAPYFGTQISVTAAGPLDLLPVEIELDRGLEARGHVVVRPSGERATGRVDYFPLWPNKHVAALGPQPGGLPAACRGAAMIRPDGSYSISVLPGPGVLGFITSKQHAPAYLSRADIDRFFGDGQNHGDENSLMVESGNFGPRPQMQKNYHALVLINPAEDATELTVDASVEPGRTLTGTVFDPAGVPLAGVRLRGPQNPIAPDLLDTPQFSLTGLDPRRPGELIFEHRARRLGALRRVTGDEKQPIEVRLEPCGSLTGRLLDVDGEPMPAAKLSVGRTGFLPHDFALETDGDGRFQIDTLVSGLSYDLTLGSAANFLRQKIIVASGEIKDLGDIRLKPSGGMPQGSTVKQNTPAGAEPSPATGAGNKAKETTR